jgi:tRNA nucleotidyltransferase (CCA-adding enzyme)
MPWSGSFAKRTGLRRHLHGSIPIEGQDVDIPVVVSPKTKHDELLTSLLPRFEEYLRASYPKTRISLTKSSVNLDFVGTKVSYDIVPMLATADPERQILIRSDGEHRETSVQRHIEFVKSRTRASAEVQGRVKFNEMIRLMKWWRDIQCHGSDGYLPSILIDLLAAHAFKHKSVEPTYADTLQKWFGFLAHEVGRQVPIYFDDYGSWASAPSDRSWMVIDPVNPANNVAGQLGTAEIERLARWFASGRDCLLEAISADLDNDEDDAIEELVPIFGGHIVHNS